MSEPGHADASARLDKRTLLLSLLDASAEREVVPAAFFLHFDPQFHRGEAAVAKHLEFFRFTEMDLVKIQFEHPFPRLEIQRPSDWAKVPCYGLDFYEPPLRVVEALVRAAKREAVVVLTLYSPFMLARQTAGEQTVIRHIEDSPEAFKRGIEAITESLVRFARACLSLGLDGFYASTQGGEAGRFSDPRAFDECIRPYDLAVWEAISEATFNILHVCDYHLPYADLGPFAGYPGHIANAPLALVGRKVEAAEVARVFGRPFMGGLDRKGVIATGPPEAIEREVAAVLATAPPRFVLAADCTVPAGTPWENLRTAVRAAHRWRR